jgi:FixJ family two-component response regulator
MPALNGLDLVSELRKHGVTAPVIMITAASDASIEQRAAALGVSQVLRKPLGTQVLLDAIRKEMA